MLSRWHRRPHQHRVNLEEWGRPPVHASAPARVPALVQHHEGISN